MIPTDDSGLNFFSVTYILISSLVIDEAAAIMGILVGFSLLLLNGAKFLKTLLDKETKNSKSLLEYIKDWFKFKSK